MKSIKKFEGKKVENMATIEGGRRSTGKGVGRNRDAITRNGRFISNSSWFRVSD